MKKKIIIIVAAVLAVAIIAVGAIFIIPAITGGKKTTPVITISSETVSQGKTVKVPVKLEKNPGFNVLNFNFTYDTSVLKYVGFSNGDVSNSEVNEESSGSLLSLTMSDELLDLKDIKKNGTLFYLEFEAIGDKGSEAEIKLNFNEGDYTNSNEENIVPEITNGKITIK